MKKIVYEKPRCNCGADLKFIGDISVIASINNDGSLNRNKILIGKEHTVLSLFCYQCSCEYTGSVDERGRILKGELIKSKVQIVAS